MAAESSPAFQFYPKDFLTDGNVAGMTLEERGAYITLLCLCWTETTLPMDACRLARMMGCNMHTFRRVWPAVARCFATTDDGYRHGRLDKEREKQDQFRAARAKSGRIGGQNKAKRSSELVAVLPDEPSKPVAVLEMEPSKPLAKPSSPISSLLSSTPVREEPQPARSKRPIFTGQRLTVFEWQLDDCSRTLGEHADAFDLHEWFFALDALAVSSGLVIPKRDGGDWLQSQLVAEAQRRGLPLRMASAAPQAGKLTTRLASAIANIQREEAGQ